MSEIPTFWGKNFVPHDLSKKRTDGRRWWVRLWVLLFVGAIFVPSVLIPSYQRYKIIKTSIRSLFEPPVDWNNKYVEIAEKTLQRLPLSHISSLKNVSVNVRKTKARRGRANASQIIINASGLSVEEFLAVFIHEMGHVVDLGTLQSIGFEPTAFRSTKVGDLSLDFYNFSWDASFIKNSKAQTTDFVSEYAQESAYEDFAESYLFYVLHGAEFRNRATENVVLLKKYNFLKQFVFKGREYDFSDDSYAYPNTFFDATLLPYEFWDFFKLSPTNREIIKKERIEVENQE